MAEQAWTANPLDPEDTGNFKRPDYFRRPDLRVVPPPPATAEFAVIDPRLVPMETVALPEPQPEAAAPAAPARPPRHAREDPLPSQATELFDLVGERLSAADMALERSSHEPQPYAPELNQLREAVRLLVRAMDALVEGVVAVAERR